MAILIVEDDPVVRTCLETHLAKAGHTTLSASCVRAAIAHLESQFPIELIICDIILPDRNGLVFVNSLRWDRRFNKIPVLMCTSLSDPGTVRRSQQLGVISYIVKPFRPGALLEKVAEALAKGVAPILLINDNEVVLDSIARMLQRNGYRSIRASTGEEALRLLDTNNVTAVITAPAVQGASGFDLLIEIKARDSSTPVLMIADHSGMAQKADVLAEGADGYVVKPFTDIDLVQRLERCIEHRRRNSARGPEAKAAPVQ